MAPGDPDYPELFTRWFEYNVFTPTLRIHGQRPATALWTYGDAATPILSDWLRLPVFADPVHLFARPCDVPDGGAVHARAVHGFPPATRR